uniref:Uncharacterized protein n=1 Tax=Meloidogyne javanica TaxID=6303 RepID=A0A915LNW9_MELJA
MIFEQLDKQEKADLKLKEKLLANAFLYSKASIYELKEFSANLIGKEECESTKKLQKSASLSSIIFKVREFIETRSDSVISINQTTKDSEEFEIEIKERRRLEEKINTKSAGDSKIESQITLEHPNFEEKTDKKLKEKLQEKTFLSSKASIKELKEFSANFVGKEEWESTRKIQKSKKIKDFQANLIGKEECESDRKIIKSARQSSIKLFGKEFVEERTSSAVFFDQSPKTWGEFEIGIKEKRKFEENLNTKSSEDFKIQSQMIFEHLNSEEKADLNLREKPQEKALFSSKASIYEKKEFSANL